MSSTLVDGKQFTCENCEKIVKVKYKDGAEIMHKESSGIHKKGVSRKLERKSDDTGYCHDCHTVRKHHNDDYRDEKVFQIIDAVSEKKQVCLNDIAQIVSNIESSVFSNLHLNTIHLSLDENSHSLFAYDHLSEDKKELQIKNNIMRYKDNIESYIMGEILENLEIAKIITYYNDAYQRELEELEMLIDDKFTFFISEQINEAESLVLAEDMTVQYPQDNLEKDVFYFKRELESSKVFSSFMIDLEAYEYELDTQQLSKIIYQKIDAF